MSTSRDHKNQPVDPEMERFYALCRRYPTFFTLMKVISRHKRLNAFIDLPAPDFLVTKEVELLELALDELVASFPTNPDQDVVSLPTIIHVLAAELEADADLGPLQA